MIGARAGAQAEFARWLRVRANVRAMSAKLAAADHALQRDARRSDDPDMGVLLTQLATERASLAALAGQLDIRIADLKSRHAAWSRHAREVLTADAKRR